MSCIQFLCLQKWQLDGRYQILWLPKLKKRLVSYSNFSLHDKIQKIYCSPKKKKKKRLPRNHPDVTEALRLICFEKTKAERKQLPLASFIRSLVLQLLTAHSSVSCLESHTKTPCTASASHLSQQLLANSSLGCNGSQEKCNLLLT